MNWSDLLTLNKFGFFGILQYMEELIGPLLFCWVACGVSLVALVEVPHHIMNCCTTIN